MDEQLGVVVFFAQGELEEQQVRSFLAAHDIPTWVRGEALRKTHALTVNGIGQVAILVSPDDETESRRLLEEAEQGHFALDESFEG